MKISDIFIVRTGKRIIESEVYSHKGDVPCVTAQTTNNGITWYADEKWLEKEHGKSIITDECITWSKDGYAGKLFYRNYKFYPNDHCGVLIPKEEYKHLIDLKWFVYTQEEYIMSFASQQGSQPMLYNQEMSEIDITLPLTCSGEIDIEYQRKYVKEYEKLYSLKKKIQNKIDEINKIFEYEMKFKTFKSIKIGNLYNLSRGNVISEEEIYHNYDKNGISVYSSQTQNNGCMGKINRIFYNKSDKKGEKNTITWTTDGANAGKVFYRNEEYLYTNVCGKMEIKSEFREVVNNELVAIILNTKASNFTNAQSSNPKLMSNQMSNIEIDLPINEKGEFDIEQQQYVLDLYKSIIDIKLKLEYIKNRILI